MLQQLREVIRNKIQSQKDKKIKNIPSFLNRISTLLEEGYTFADSISMLLPYHVEKVEHWRGIIEEKLRNGADVSDVLESFLIPKHYLVAIRIAEESGEMAAALKNVSEQIDFNEKMRKKLIRLLTYPVILVILLTGIFLGFRMYFLPNIEQIIQSRSTNVDNSVLKMSKLFLHIPDYLIFVSIIIIIALFVFIFYLRKLNIERQMLILLNLPIVSYFYRIQMTRQLSRLLGSLIISGFSLQQALGILQQQQLNIHLSYVSSKLEKRIIYGDSLSNAVSIEPYFFSKFEEFIKHGEKSGYLGRELIIYCELLDEKLQYIVKITLSIVQPLFFIVIALCILAAYLSILLPMYKLIEII